MLQKKCTSFGLELGVWHQMTQLFQRFLHLSLALKFRVAVRCVCVCVNVRVSVCVFVSMSAYPVCVVDH